MRGGEVDTGLARFGISFSYRDARNAEKGMPENPGEGSTTSLDGITWNADAPRNILKCAVRARCMR